MKERRRRRRKNYIQIL